MRLMVASETYDPTDDILNFRGYRLPWVYVDASFRLLSEEGHYLNGSSVRPMAYNAYDELVLLFDPDNDPLHVCRSPSPDGPYGEVIGTFENIMHFVHEWLPPDVKERILPKPSEGNE